jgi:hypothetical protein
MSSWRGLSRPPRHLSSADVTILIRPPGRGGVILEDDPPILSEKDDGSPLRG